jgi:signal peptidase I
MNSDIKLFDSLGWSWSWTRAFNAAKPALLSIPVISIITVLMYMVSIIDMGFFWIVGLGLITGVVSAIISGCLAGLVATQPKNKDSIVLTPNRGIWKSAQKSVAASLFALIVVILPTTFLSNYFLPLSVLLGCIGLYAGGLACLQHLTIRTLFWQTNNAPWDYIHFLNYTKKRLLMKQVGGSYLFIHDLLCQNLTSEKDWIKPKLSWQSFSKRIIVGIIIGIIGLNSILLPIAINSWRVGDETAQLFFPRLQLGDRVLTDRLSPRIGKLNQRDIITFKATPEMPENLRNTRMKGEVIGCSGDTLIVRKGKTLIQGKPISDKYLNAYQKYQRSLNSSFDAVPDSNYLVATKYTKQDNFIVAKIPIINIEERAIIKIWPNFTLFIF